MKKKKTFFWITIIAVVFTCVIIWRTIVLIQKKDSSFNNNIADRIIAVEVEVIKIGSISEVIELTGTIYPEYQFIIAPKISGRLVKVYYNIGDFVKENEIIAEIDDAEYQQSLFEAQANLRIAEANLAEVNSQLQLTQRELERVKSLAEKEYISQSKLEEANANLISYEAKLDLAFAQIEQKKAALKVAEIKLSYTILRATKSGFIAEKFSDEGSLLNTNSPIVSVVGIDRVIIRSNLVEKIYGRIKPGQEAKIENDAFADRVFYGQVSRIAPVLQEDSRTAEMEIEIDNRSHLLKPGMFCRLKIILEEKTNVQLIPNKAIVYENDKAGIFMVDNNNNLARYIQVQTGITSENRTEILQPEISGYVITVGQYQLRDGSKILLPDTSKTINE